MENKRITIAKGDGIGPEIMDATLEILKASGAQIEIDEIEIGEKVYLSGNTSGIASSSWDTLKKNKVFLKAPITTPQGGGYKSLNVTTRKMLGLYANVRPCITYTPFVGSKHHMDLVIIRENEEDLYAGIEHQQTDEVIQCIKLISRPGCEKIVRYAFEYAKQNGRKKVTCMSKDNIMKQTDGLFHGIFNEIGLEYPEIEKDHWIIDIGSARIADTPEMFDVIVTLNLYGDIISDIASQIAGSVGLSGSSNIGDGFAMFEAIHGSAPTIAGQGIANPSGLIQGAVMMLIHIGETKAAELIQNAWLKTLEDGIHTGDIFNATTSKLKVGTKMFAAAVIERLGQKPTHLKLADYASTSEINIQKYIRKAPAVKALIGVDVFTNWTNGTSEDLGNILSAIKTEGLELAMISNRGIKVWPDGFKETFCTDQWCCRFQSKDNLTVTPQQIIAIQEQFLAKNVEVIKTENLYTFNGKIGFSLGQGQ